LQRSIAYATITDKAYLKTMTGKVSEDYSPQRAGMVKAGVSSSWKAPLES